ncbi:MAG: pyridoxal-dependent decarboxylase [Pseudomonadota bacterium]
MNWDAFAEWGARFADWGAEYHKTIRSRPVRAKAQPGDTAARLPATPPEAGEPMEQIFADFEEIIMPGMTHHQHPGFFAYFPTNATPPSILAEYLIANLSAQCMIWQTAPSANELETLVLDWIRQALGLPAEFQGVVQGSASEATLVASLTMRERSLGWTGNSTGLSGRDRLRVYATNEVHSSIDRAMWVSGIGQDNLVSIPTQGPRRSMNIEKLREAIREDITAGHRPAGIIACVGGTSTGAVDQIADVVEVAQEFDLYVHVDAAWAGNAMLCPELRTLWDGVEKADSVVFNPQKWMGGQFDGSMHFVRAPEDLNNTLSITPEYLKTHGKEGFRNYSEWSIPLGRRFRALKYWFLIRSYGLEDIRNRIRNHITWSCEVCERIRQMDGFEIVTEPVLSLFTFRCPGDDETQQRLVDALNDDGRIYVTQGLHDGRKMIRFQVGQFDATRDDVLMAVDVIEDIWRKSQ